MFSGGERVEIGNSRLKLRLEPLEANFIEEDMVMRYVKVVSAMLIVLLAGYAYAADKMPEGVQVRKSDAGAMVLADAKGMTLYTRTIRTQMVSRTAPGDV